MVAVGQVLQLIVELIVPGVDQAGLASGRIGGLVASVLGGLLLAIVGIVLSAALTGLLLVVLSRAVLGQRIGLREAWHAVASRLPGLVGLTVLITVAIGALFLVVMLPALVVAATGSATAIGLAFLLACVAVAGAAYLSVLWALAPAAYVLEPIGVPAALGRSGRLVRGSWWRTFGVLLLSAFLVALPAIVVMGLFGTFTFRPAVAGLAVRAAIAYLIVGTFATPFVVGVTGLLYIDRRIRRERFDLDLARSVS